MRCPFFFVKNFSIWSTIWLPQLCSRQKDEREVIPMGRLTLSQEELASLYQRHFRTVYQICLMLMKNVPDAEDAAQTVFRKAMEQGGPFRDPEHEKAWLIVTARNECRNQLKHWWRTRRADSGALDSLVWEQPQDQEVWDQVAALPKPHRLVLYLHYYQGYATGEIAEMLGENPSTVRSRLVQARKKLKLKLEEEGYGPS